MNVIDRLSPVQPTSENKNKQKENKKTSPQREYKHDRQKWDRLTPKIIKKKKKKNKKRRKQDRKVNMYYKQPQGDSCTGSGRQHNRDRAPQRQFRVQI